MTSSTASEGAPRRTARASAPDQGARRSSGSSGSRRRPARKKALSTRMGEWLLAHPLVAAVLCTAFIVGTVALVFWYTNFSGISSSADFVYSKF